MDEIEFEHRKAQLWVAFGAAALVDPRNSTAGAAERADAMLNEFERRFVVRNPE